MRDLRNLDDGRKAALVIGGIGVLAIAMLVGSWWAITSTGPSFAKAGTPAAAMTVAPQRVAAPTTSFVVPTPSWSAPTSVPPPGPRAPLLPPELAVQQVPSSPAAPPAPPAPPPPSSAPPQQAQVSGVTLACESRGRGVRATLRLISTGPVPVSVTAGPQTQSAVVTGRAQLSASAADVNPRTTTCSAVVAGREIGPIPAR